MSHGAYRTPLVQRIQYSVPVGHVKGLPEPIPELCSHEAVDDEVNRTVEDDQEPAVDDHDVDDS